MTDRTLGHLRVLELCSLVTGPYCAKLLADLGAEVTKIEPPRVGDGARRRGPFLNDAPHGERSGTFLYLNTNKLGITLDIGTAAGRAIFLELTKDADVLVEDNPPAVMEKLGLTYEQLRKVNPRLVMTSITPFGQTGPYRDCRAYELNCVHAGGEGYMMPIESPFPERGPVKGGGLVADCVCGLSAALATLAAAYRMSATGAGQHIDVSRQDVLMTLVGLEVAMYTYSGVVRSRHCRAALMPVPLETRDGYVMISAFYDRDWNRFVEYIGESWARDGRFGDLMARWRHAPEINEKVEGWARDHGKDELFHDLQSRSIAAAPSNTSEDLVKSPQLEARGFFAEIDHQEAGRLKYPTVPYRFSASPFVFERPAPVLGQHNRLVYCGRLGFGEQDLVRMSEAGIV